MAAPFLSHEGTAAALLSPLYVFDLEIGEALIEQSRKVKILSSWKPKGAFQSRPEPLYLVLCKHELTWKDLLNIWLDSCSLYWWYGSSQCVWSRCVFDHCRLQIAGNGGRHSQGRSQMDTWLVFCRSFFGKPVMTPKKEVSRLERWRGRE